MISSASASSTASAPERQARRRVAQERGNPPVRLEHRPARRLGRMGGEDELDPSRAPAASSSSSSTPAARAARTRRRATRAAPALRPRTRARRRIRWCCSAMFASWKKSANARSTAPWRSTESAATAPSSARATRPPVRIAAREQADPLLVVEEILALLLDEHLPSRSPRRRTFARRARSPPNWTDRAMPWPRDRPELQPGDLQARHGREDAVAELDDNLAANRILVRGVGVLPVAREQERVDLIPGAIGREQRLPGRARSGIPEELDERFRRGDAVVVERVVLVQLRRVLDSTCRYSFIAASPAQRGLEGSL